MRVLIIEDDRECAKMSKLFLAMGFPHIALDIEIVETAADGVREIANNANPVDVALLDLRLPDGNPRETLHKFAAFMHRVKVIVLTGIDDGDVAMDAVNAGAVAVVCKPGLQELKDAFGRIVNNTEA